MTDGLDFALAALMATDMLLMISSRAGTVIRLLAVQGLLLSLVATLVHWPDVDVQLWGVIAGSFALKGLLFPWLLARTSRRLKVQRETEPFVSYTASVVAGAAFVGIAMWLGSRLDPPGEVASSLAVPVTLFTVMAGLFILVARRRALTQVAGFIVLENGIFVFSASLATEQPLLVEMGVLLDVFVAVFVMGITIHQINREFDSVDTDALSALRDTRR